MSLKPKKSLGQNFLIDKNISQKIVQSLDCKEDKVIEIGPGTGALTEWLNNENIELFAIEIDKSAVELLLKKFPPSRYPKLHIINSDILSSDFDNLIKESNANFKVIGNLPYNISSQIIFKLIANRNNISKAILMLQKEVAQRLVAKPHTKDYGITSVALQLVGKVSKLFDVSPNCFYPKPKITSSIIEIEFYQNNNLNDFDKILLLIKNAFSQRRKVLKNSLKSYINQQFNVKLEDVVKIAENSGLNYFSQRAEELSIDDYVIFYDFFNSNKDKF